MSRTERWVSEDNRTAVIEVGDHDTVLLSYALFASLLHQLGWSLTPETEVSA